MINKAHEVLWNSIIACRKDSHICFLFWKWILNHTYLYSYVTYMRDLYIPATSEWNFPASFPCLKDHLHHVKIPKLFLNLLQFLPLPRNKCPVAFHVNFTLQLTIMLQNFYLKWFGYGGKWTFIRRKMDWRIHFKSAGRLDVNCYIMETLAICNRFRTTDAYLTTFDIRSKREFFLACLHSHPWVLERLHSAKIFKFTIANIQSISVAFIQYRIYFKESQVTLMLKKA